MPEDRATHPQAPAGAELAPSECACPVDPRIARHFDRRSLKRRGVGQRYEMGKVSRKLLAALLAAGPAEQTVLELGCGPGALLTELLAAGAQHATGVDLSPEPIEEARQRTAEAGFAERVTFAVGDGARMPLVAHDWVVLDKVICCYPDAASLLANSIVAARGLYGFAVPASQGWRGALARIQMWLEDVASRLRGRPCPGYVHDVDIIEGRLEAAGFRPSYRGTTWTWHVAVFERVAAA